jgi:hypothetical protein
VIAAASHLSENSIGRLSNAEWPVLCHASARPHPRRGAAGLLLADAAQASLITGRDEQPAASAAQCQRDSCADDARRDTDTCLASTASAVLQAAQVDGGAIVAVTADTGHRTSRVTELMHVVTAAAPQLDPGADVISIGSSCGSCGAVTWLTALAWRMRKYRTAAVLCSASVTKILIAAAPRYYARRWRPTKQPSLS